MTPYEVALRMMRGRGGTVNDPEFITAYLEAEIEKVPDKDGLRLSPHYNDILRVQFMDAKKTFQKMEPAFREALIIFGMMPRSLNKTSYVQAV